MGLLWVLFGFKGRLRRRDFWVWVLAIWLIYLAVIADGGVTLPRIWHMTPGYGRRLALLAGLPVFGWVSAALLTKRLHDRNLPMFAVLRVLTPVKGWIWGASECCSDGTRGPNRFGACPKGTPGVSEFF